MGWDKYDGDRKIPCGFFRSPLCLLRPPLPLFRRSSGVFFGNDVVSLGTAVWKLPHFVQESSALCARNFRTLCKKLPHFVQESSALCARNYRTLCKKVPYFVQESSALCARKFRTLCKKVPHFVHESSDAPGSLRNLLATRQAWNDRKNPQIQKAYLRIFVFRLWVKGLWLSSTYRS